MIRQGIFSEDLLKTIRESIQFHRSITWVFSGSHEITELRSVPWTSYLISMRTIMVSMFTREETTLLLTQPMKYSTLWGKDFPNRPSFTLSFWGEKGIERIYRESGGWPHLVQLIAEAIIDLINNEKATSVNDQIIERSLDKAVTRGHSVLYDLMRAESRLPGEWDYIVKFLDHDSQLPPDDEGVNRSLRRRELIDKEGDKWRLRVPLMQRWLRTKFL